ncbi:unnamed protein product [Cuscuta campestris]|uniref:Major facilitator superfamily (MFS) profile domain-containing protein n=1 Tax=Cuscuta campestris TaxID=132261 RepID=A0A484N6T8_9ASTE|nr:unnamed protein product [Cuscuta campestris]
MEGLGLSRGGSKWTAAAASVWIQSSCGGSYAFGIYSPVLKSSQSYDQSTLDTVSVFKDIGANAGILSGLLYSAVSNSRPSPRRGGPWLVHLAGAAQCFVGYFFMYLAVVGAIPRPPVAVMSLFMFIAAHSQTFFNTANVVTAVLNFPDYGGTVVGIMKGFLGLSGAMLIQLYQTLFNNNNPSALILMLALLPTAITLALMCSVKVHRTSATYTNDDDEKKRLNTFLIVSMVIATYLLCLRILEGAFVFPRWVHILSFVGLLALLSSPLSVATKAQGSEGTSSSYAETLLLNDSNIANRVKRGNVVVVEEMNVLKAMCTLNFWLLFVSMVCGMGSGLATVNNISQIGESFGYTASQRSTMVSLWSIWNFLGRIGAGYVSDIALLKRGWPRPLFVALSLVAMSAGHVIIASGFPGNLYVGTMLAGICYGSQWSLMPTITKEIFGVLHMGTIFNTIAIASPVGSYVLSVRVIGYLYDREASSRGHESSCFGTRCFMLSYFILASVTLFGFLVALSLFIRTRRFYSQALLGVR